MQKYKINGKSITLPDGWHDVTYQHGIHILENQLNDVELFAFFSGMSEKEVRELNKEDDIYYFMQGFPFLKSLPIEKKPDIPRSIRYKGELYYFPHVLMNDPYDFGDSTVGQIEDMKAIIAKMSKEFTEEEDRAITNLELMKIFPPVVAIYIQPIIEKKYDYKRAMKMADELQSIMSFKDVVLMGNFFLMKLAGSVNGSKRALHLPRWIQKKLRQAYRKLISYLDSMLP